MLSQLIALFLSAFLGGTTLLLLPNLKPAAFKIVLIFVSSYLFSITLLHLLPDLLALQSLNNHVGFYMLIGFFLEPVLAFFSKSLGHSHTDHTSLSERNLVSFTFLSSLSIHAFLDGVLLSNAIASPLQHTHTHTAHSLLIGIVLHKASDAFALVSILNKLMTSKNHIIFYLLLFSLTSPLGLLASKYGSQQFLCNQNILIALAAISGGYFLHISTTIFFENSNSYRVDIPTLVAIAAGISMVALLEYCL